MRRKSSRNSTKASPEKVKEPKKSRRQSRRHKQSSSESDSDDDIPLSRTQIRLQETGDEEKPPEKGQQQDDPVWQVTQSQEPNTPDLQKIKICLTRPSPATPEHTRRHRSKSGSQHEDVQSPEEKVTRRSRRFTGSPKNEEHEDSDEKRSKGKSKGKNKSKLDHESSLNETAQSEISENVQVTAQSPQIDNVDNNDVDSVDHGLSQMDDVAAKSDSNNVGSDKAECREQPPVESDETDSNKQMNEAHETNETNEGDSQTRVIVESAVVKVASSPKSIQNDVQIDESIENDTPKVDESKQREEINSCINESEKSIKDDNTEVVTSHPSSEVSQETTEKEQITELIKSDSKEIIPEPSIPTKRVEQPYVRTSIKLNRSSYAQPMEVDTPTNFACEEINKDKSESNITPEDAPSSPIKEEKTDDKTIDSNKQEDEDTNKSINKIEDENDSNKQFETEKLTEVCEEPKDNSNNKESDPEEKLEFRNESPPVPQEKVERTLTVTKHRRHTGDVREVQKIELNLRSKSMVEETLDTPKIKRKPSWKSLGLKLFGDILEVSTDYFKDMCPEISLLDEEEVKLETKERLSFSSDIEVKKLEDKRRDSLEPKDKSSAINVENIIAMNRKISIVDDDASKLKPPPSPAKNDKSDILYITNLVRPFTVKQLRELLSRTGTIIDEGFWTDKIKSKCFVQYSTADEAEATRNALHGVHWPICNGKKLIIDYSTLDGLELAKNPPPIAPVVPVIPEKENQEPEQIVPKKTSKEQEKTPFDGKRRDANNSWELESPKEVRGRQTRSKERHDKRKHSRTRHSRSATPGFTKKKTKKQEEAVPQRAMDDLFRKTAATPCIYWQPLSPEEIALKQQQRLERMAEHKRRMETQTRNKRGGEYSGRGVPYRRRY